MKRLAEIMPGKRLIYRGVECLKLHIADSGVEKSPYRQSDALIANVATGRIYGVPRNHRVTPILSQGVQA